MNAADETRLAAQSSTRLEIRKLGNSTGLIFPKELLARLGLKQGDALFATLTPDGGVHLTPLAPTFEQAMEIARRGMDIYRNALAELAK